LVARLIGRVVLRAGSRAVEAEALFDTGAAKSFVDVSIAEKLGYVKYGKPKEILLATKNVKAYAIGYLVARATIEGVELSLEHVFGVVKDLRHAIVIGMDIIEPYEIALDVKEGKVKFRKYPPTIEIV